MRVLVTGGSGALGRAAVPVLRTLGHEVDAPEIGELDLFDPAAVMDAVARCGAIVHLATRIPPRERRRDLDAWRENDCLRAEASRILVEAGIAAGSEVYVQPTVTFVYPKEGRVDEETPLDAVPAVLRSALAAERETARFARGGRRGVVLRLGLLDGPGTGNDTPDRSYGATLHVADAARALAAALDIPSGVYNVCRDGECV